MLTRLFSILILFTAANSFCMNESIKQVSPQNDFAPFLRLRDFTNMTKFLLKKDHKSLATTLLDIYSKLEKFEHNDLVPAATLFALVIKNVSNLDSKQIECELQEGFKCFNNRDVRKLLFHYRTQLTKFISAYNNKSEEEITDAIDSIDEDITEALSDEIVRLLYLPLVRVFEHIDLIDEQYVVDTIADMQLNYLDKVGTIFMQNKFKESTIDHIITKLKENIFNNIDINYEFLIKLVEDQENDVNKDVIDCLITLLSKLHKIDNFLLAYSKLKFTNQF